METEKIIEGNKLIANFMAVKNEISDIFYLPQHGHYSNCYGQIEWNECFRTDELKYHSSYDWLIPVVEKIETLGSNHFNFNEVNVVLYSYFNIEGKKIKLFWSRDHKYQLQLEVLPQHLKSSNINTHKEYIRASISKETTKIEALFIACVEFIKWYNKEKLS